MRLRTTAVFATVLLFAFAGTSCSSRFVAGDAPAADRTPAPSGPAPANGLVQSSDGGSVSIDMKWLGQQNGQLVFQVAMDTHSVELDGFDLSQSAMLTDDSGARYQPLLWEAPSGGHHRSGTLAFAIPEGLKEGTAEYIKIVIRDVSGVAERVMTWQLK